jgi:hypothetical protein
MHTTAQIEVVELVGRTKKATRLQNSGLGRIVAVVERTDAHIVVAPRGCPRADSPYATRVLLTGDAQFRIRG